MISRRTLLKTAASASLLPVLPLSVRADSGWRQAMDSSPLIYLTPIRSDGAESRCQSEIWFAGVDGDFYVVTGHSAWRSEAIRRGLNQARIWVGDVGPASASDGGYKTLPMVNAMASIETDTKVWELVLAVMGTKYSDEWGKWGPRFKKGLADGSRAMLKYAPLVQ